MADESFSPDDESSTIEIPRSYQHLPSQDEEDTENLILNDASQHAARRTLQNFALMSILFSANHGCVSGRIAKGHVPCGEFDRICFNSL